MFLHTYVYGSVKPFSFQRDQLTSFYFSIQRIYANKSSSLPQLFLPILLFIYSTTYNMALI